MYPSLSDGSSGIVFLENQASVYVLTKYEGVYLIASPLSHGSNIDTQFNLPPLSMTYVDHKSLTALFNTATVADPGVVRGFVFVPIDFPSLSRNGSCLL